MIALKVEDNKSIAHTIVVCEICKVEIDILHCLEYERRCEKIGWTKKIEYVANAPIGEKYKLFHWCPKCSLEHKNILQGAI